MIEQLVARLAAAQKKLDALEIRERPLALRGWRDDFLGDALHEQYNLVVNAGGAGALQNNAHGGIYRLSVPNAAGAYARLFLGDGAGGYSTVGMNAGEATVIITRMKLSVLGTGQGTFGAYKVGTTNLCQAGYSSAISPNWLIWSRDNAGGISWTLSTIAADTDWHVLRFEIEPTILTLWVDGDLACTHTANLPINYLEPFWQAYRDSGALNVDLDYVSVIPQNLV